MRLVMQHCKADNQFLNSVSGVSVFLEEKISRDCRSIYHGHLRSCKHVS